MFFADIYNFFDKIAPFNTQMDFDNSGLLVGNMNDFVEKILICLDITYENLEHAIDEKCQLIISHHPIIFNPIKNIDSNSVLYLLAKYQIGALCVHTNLDLASKNSVNTFLLDKLGLKPLEALSFYNGLPVGYCSSLKEETTAKNFAKILKENLKCTGVRYTNHGNILKIAEVSGSGGSFIKDAIKMNVSGFVTGEIKYNQILEADAAGISIFEVGHFSSENVMVEKVYDILSENFKNLNLIKSKICSDNVLFL